MTEISLQERIIKTLPINPQLEIIERRLLDGTCQSDNRNSTMKPAQNYQTIFRNIKHDYNLSNFIIVGQQHNYL
jgi:hypothetical protein